jgi:hypothetical protein
MKEVAEKVRLIIDVDQQVHKVGSLQPRLDEFLRFLYCIRLLLALQSREVELTLLAMSFSSPIRAKKRTSRCGK